MKDFWLKVIKSGTGVSSKRLMGTICIFFAMFFALLGLFLNIPGAVDSTVSTVIIEFLAAGVALFGVTAWERRGSNVNGLNQYDFPPQSSYPTNSRTDSEKETCNDDELELDEDGRIIKKNKDYETTKGDN